MRGAAARHANIETTMRHYTDLSRLDLRGAVEHAAPPVPGKASPPVATIRKAKASA